MPETSAPVAPRPEDRAFEIDAVRGWAALSVVCFHLFWEAFGIVVPAFRNPYTAMFLAGSFDVVVFFILSGDALTFPFFHGGGERYLQRAAIRRYPRLTVPILIVTAATAAATAVGLNSNVAAAEVVGRMDWGGLNNFVQPSLEGLLKFALVQVYQANGGPSYLPFLWTMPIELAGSFLLFTFLFVYPRLRCGALWALAMAFLLVRSQSFLGCFLVGMLLGQARAAGVFDRLPKMAARYGSALGIAGTLAFVGRRQYDGDGSVRSLTLAGAALLFSIYANRDLVRWLSRDRVSQFLGRISYLLYLWHFTVLATFTSGLIVWRSASGHGLSRWDACLIAISSVAASIILAGSTLVIERRTRDVMDLVLRVIWREGAGDLAARPARRIG